jgi:ABC-type transport system involved in multi-copper enzyme maturation permease subunit
MTFLPIAERELRVAARHPLTFWVRWAAALGCLLLWAVLGLANRRLSTSELSQLVFTAFGIVAFGFTLLCGVFLTSDCLSEEKREGTLGLLFLTDLKGFDVVAGKLAATSLHVVFALLAIFPIMAIPLLMGGVSPGEFWRLLLVLLITLFWSLGLGMLSSALRYEARQSMATTLFAILAWTGLLPALWWFNHILFRRNLVDFLLLPSPAFAFRAAYDFGYRLSNGKEAYWLSVTIIAFVALGCFIAAAVALPRLWQDARPAREEKATVRGLRDPLPQAYRRWHFPDPDPCFWLASRDSLRARTGLVAMLILLCVWGVFFVLSIAAPAREGFIICVFSAYAVHQLAKYLMVVEATRQMSLDRNSGALELLLVTPLQDHEVISGYSRAFRQRFVPLVGTLALLNVCLCLLTVGYSRLSMNSSDRAIFFELFAGGVITLLLDFRTLGKIGLLRAIHTKSHNRAILGTLMRVMLPPWAAIILMVFVMQSTVRSAEGAAVTFAFWFGFGIVTDLILNSAATLELRKGLRELVCGEPAAGPGASRPMLAPSLRPAKV